MMKMLLLLFQAHQEVPAWLEQAAQQSYGGGFSNAGRFGGRDARRGGGKVTNKITYTTDCVSNKRL